MLSGRRTLQGICEAGAEREINYLSPNAKQRKQMSRGRDELQIVGPPFSHGSPPIMSNRQGRGEEGPETSAAVAREVERQRQRL